MAEWKGKRIVAIVNAPEISLTEDEKAGDESKIKSTNTRSDFYEVKEEQRDSIYSGSLPLSLDILKLKELAPNEFYTKIKKRKIYKGGIVKRKDGEKLYTDAIISVTFDRASYEVLDELRLDLKVGKNNVGIKNVYKEKKSNKSARALREQLYEEGVILRQK